MAEEPVIVTPSGVEVPALDLEMLNSTAEENDEGGSILELQDTLRQKDEMILRLKDELEKANKVGLDSKLYLLHRVLLRVHGVYCPLLSTCR